MSIRKTQSYLSEALKLFRSQYLILCGLAGSAGLFVWTQDLVPIAGAPLSSIALTLICARLFLRGRPVNVSGLIGLGFLFFPLHMLWTVLMSVHMNIGLRAALPWSTLPIAIFMSIALTIWARATAQIATVGTGLDQALKNAFVFTIKETSSLIWLWILMGVAIAFSMATQGVGFLITAPLGFAILKVLSYRDAGVRAG